MGISNKSCFMFSVVFLCLSFKKHLSLGADTVSANQSLSGDRTIVSAGGNFELGFFKPGNSCNYYIGIWFKKVSTITPVWVANRDAPIPDKYPSELKILNGNLVLFNDSQTAIWSTNQNSTTSNSVVAVLLDDGNLVLRDGLNLTLWQSFDHPGDTWMPGGKFGYNKITNTQHGLTSWKNVDDPAEGLFSLHLDTNNSQFLLLWNWSQCYWTSLPFNKGLSFPIGRSSFADNDNEIYLTYYTYNRSMISRFIIDVSGQVKFLIWWDSDNRWGRYWYEPWQECEVYALCGPFGACNQITQPFCNCLKGFNPKSAYDWNLNDYSGGCVRRTELKCGNASAANGNEDGFLAYSNMRLPKHPQSVAVGSATECESSCLNNCSCSAYAFDGNGCSIWVGDLFHLQQLSENDGSGTTFYLRLAASELSSAKNDGSGRTTYFGAAGGSVAAVVLLLGLAFFVSKRNRRLAEITFWLLSNTCSSSLNKKQTATVVGPLVVFRYKDLQKATKSFSVRLGRGGFGSVFRGTLPDSTVIAVKKLETISQGEKEFRAEVCSLGTIQHVNLVRLRGFCSEGNKKLLVYDYMQNGSLDSHLFHEKDAKVLDWKTRYEIALGTARGLAYLHEKCRDCIIHYDIKPENILLDVDFFPKISDFGLAKLVGRKFSRVLTAMRGTVGYIAPEWILGVAITAKADVYSYGMLLFELISGRRNTMQSEVEKTFFPIWAASVVTEGGDVFSLLDHRLERNVDTEELCRICRVACWCIQDDESHRPPMGLIAQILQGDLDVDIPPIPRFLQALVDDPDSSI